MSVNYTGNNINKTLGTIGFDTTFELSEFNEPRIRSEMETIKNTLLFILLSKPGAYPSLPQIGLDIETALYDYYDELDIADLKTKIIEQCAILGAYISAGTIDIRKLIYKNQPSLIIHIEGSEVFPASYKNDQVGRSDRFMIGITFDDLKELIYSVNAGSD